MKENYFLTKAAEADLRDIIIYTIEEWDKNQGYT